MKGLFLVVSAVILVYVSVASSELNVVCPSPIYEDYANARHPCNCSIYFECRGDEKLVRKCEPPLLFNPEIQLCDWPSRVKCVVDSDCPQMGCRRMKIHCLN